MIQAHIGLQRSSLSRFTLVVLAFASFTIALGYGVLLPHLPDLIAARVVNGRDPRALARGVAWITGLFVAASILFSPFWGRLSDRIGRRPVMSIGLIGYAATSILPPIDIGIDALYAVRFANGIFAAAVGPAVLAAVADLCDVHEARARGFAWMGIASAAGYFFGSILGGLDPTLSEARSRAADGLPMALSISALLALCVLIALYFLPSGRPSPSLEAADHPLRGERSLAYRLLILSSVAAAAVAAFEVAMTIHARGLGLGPERLAVIFAECSLIVLAAQALIFFPRWSSKTTRHLVTPAFVVMAVGLVLSPIASNFPASMAATGAVAAAGGLIAPILAYWLSLASEQQHGLSQGRNSAVVSFGQTIGTLAAGYLVGLYNMPDAPFVSIAAIVALAALSSLGLSRRLEALAWSTR